MDWLKVLPKIAPFHLFNTEDVFARADRWREWARNYAIYAQAVGLDELPQSRQVAVLLSLAGSGVQDRILWLEEKGLPSRSIEEVLAHSTAHFAPKLPDSVLLDQIKLRDQRPGESAREFVDALQQIVGRGEFPDQIRERAVMNQMVRGTVHEQFRVDFNSGEIGGTIGELIAELFTHEVRDQLNKGKARRMLRLNGGMVEEPLTKKRKAQLRIARMQQEHLHGQVAGPSMPRPASPWQPSRIAVLRPQGQNRQAPASGPARGGRGGRGGRGARAYQGQGQCAHGSVF